MSSDDDRAVLEFYLFLEIIGDAQYTPENFKSFCTTYLSTSTLTPIQRLSRFFKSTGNSCSYNSFSGYVSSVGGTTIDKDGWSRQWTYQTCREFGYGQGIATASGVFSPLKYATNNVLLNKLCQSAYGIANVDANVAATNQRYGGLKINVENVVFPSSSYDPWSALALSNSTGVVNSKSQVVYIDGGSHCRDMYASKSTDTASVQWAHTQIQAAVKRFLSKK
ncbi:Thymus-specific serine protease [Aphanomyces cochlioides]|nr:Thymus-specific serine protease [Aphanomyces cochlioides]